MKHPVVLEEAPPQRENAVGFSCIPSPHDSRAGWYPTICTMAAIVAVFVVVFGFLMRPAFVRGESMSPTLEEGDFLLIQRLFSMPEQGDIVVLFAPQFNHPIVKRVIAVEGQTVDLDGKTGTVTVDGKVLDEPYLKDPLLYTGGGSLSLPAVVPENCIFVLGDNRNDSTDSRDIGFIPQSAVLGKAVLRVFPPTGTAGL